MALASPTPESMFRASASTTRWCKRCVGRTAGSRASLKPTLQSIQRHRSSGPSRPRAPSWSCQSRWPEEGRARRPRRVPFVSRPTTSRHRGLSMIGPPRTYWPDWEGSAPLVERRDLRVTPNMGSFSRTSRPPSCVARPNLDDLTVLHAVNSAREILDPIAGSGRITDQHHANM